MHEPKPILRIEYCVGCKWLMRAGWTAQELLSTFGADLGGVTLAPSADAGTFRVTCGDHVLHDRKADGGFLELKVLKQRVRDLLFPGQGLGHSDAPLPTFGS
jgi:selenoprotein W-related protein